MGFTLINDLEDLKEGIVKVNTIPIPKEIIELMEALKNEGYIGKETRAEDFAILFGRPIGIEEPRFTKIRWMAANYLLYEFVSALPVLSVNNNQHNKSIGCFSSPLVNADTNS